MKTINKEEEIADSLAALRASMDAPGFRSYYAKGVEYLLGRRLDPDAVPAAADRIFHSVECTVLKDNSLCAVDLPRLIRKAIDTEAIRTRGAARTTCGPRERELTARLAQLKPKELSSLRSYYNGDCGVKQAVPAIAKKMRKAFFQKGIEPDRPVVDFGKAG